MVSEEFQNFKRCPVATTFRHLGKKWSINLIGTILRGKTQFKELLLINKGLSGKVLSQRLKELEKEGFIKKIIVSKTPLRIEYHITEKGKTLRNIIYEITMFSLEQYPKEMMINPDKYDRKSYSKAMKEMYGMK